MPFLSGKFSLVLRITLGASPVYVRREAYASFLYFLVFQSFQCCSGEYRIKRFLNSGGIPEEPQEKWVDTERIINEFISSNLGWKAGEIERAHGVGRPKADHIRPIVVKFLNFKDKSTILRNASKLKDLQNPRVWIEEDFSARMQLIRKKLRDFARKERKPNEKYTVTYNKLLLGNKCYTFDSSKNQVTCLTRRDEAEVSALHEQTAVSTQGDEMNKDD